MAKSDPLLILLDHNSWATRQLLELCGTLAEDDFHKPFDMGPGSLHNTITHILGAMQGWHDLLAGGEPRPRLEEKKRTASGLITLLDDLAAELQTTAAAHPLDEILRTERAGKAYAFTRGAILTHVTTHGMHHRAQCLNMLRQQGAKLPPSSVMEWTFITDPIDPIDPEA